jgi:hypothetical protein
MHVDILVSRRSQRVWDVVLIHVGVSQRLGDVQITNWVVYYETIKRELNKRLLCKCRCDERLKDTPEGSTFQWTCVFVFIIRGKVRVEDNIYKWLSV